MMQRRRVASGLALTIAVLSLAFVPSADAATEVGNGCAATHAQENLTLVQLSQSSTALPLAVPAAGVVTKWKVNSQFSEPLPQTFNVLRPAGTNQFTAVGEASATVAPGANSFDTRIPVQPGDRPGLSSSVATLYCEGAAESDVLYFFEGNLPVGSTTIFGTDEPFVVPVVAVIEPDADGDGFGDETQDKCPQSASTQAECPLVVLDSYGLAKKSSIVVLVAASESGPVTVSGTAQLPKSSKAASSAKAKLKKVKKNVTAGKIGRFTLKFPASLKSALKGLPRGKSITVKLQASATNVAGQVSKDKAKVKLKG
jgi:hypothetical protein